MNFEDLLNSVSEVNPGDVVTAEVLTVDNDQANVVIEGTGVEINFLHSSKYL